MATNTTLKTKRQIRNPEKWVGKCVLHMDYHNWKWGERGYFVCETTGKLFRISDEAYYGDYFETLEDAEARRYDACYYYSDEGLREMASL